MNQALKHRLAQAAGCLSPPLHRAIEPYFSEVENKAWGLQRLSCHPPNDRWALGTV